MKKTFIISMMLSMMVTLIHAQKSTYTGKVIDKTTRKPVELAVIKINNTTNFTSTNANGEFQLTTDESHLAIEINHISYKKTTINLTTNCIIQLTPKSILLENITINAEDVSQSTIVVDNTKKATQPRNAADLFGDIPGFGLIKRSTYAIDPVFRSFKEDQLNIQYDGGMRTMNACPNRMDPVTTHLIPEEIDKIEIVRGPFSVRFGENFGGVINLQTKSGADFDSGIHGTVEGGFESNGDSYMTRASLAYKKEKFDMLANAEYRDYGNYEDGNGIETPSSFKSIDYSLKTGLNITKDQRAQLTWRQTFGDDILHAGLPMDSPKDDSYLIGADYKIKNISDKLYSVTFKGYYSYVDHLMDNFSRPNFKMMEASTPVEATAYGGKLEFTLTPSEKTMVYLGADASILEREGTKTVVVKIKNGTKLPAPVTKYKNVWQDASKSIFGVFAEMKHQISTNLSISSGLRADLSSTKMDAPEQSFLDMFGGSVDDKSDTSISGFIALKKKFETGQMQLSVGSGTKTPTMKERYVNRMTLGNDPYELIGNPNLKPERNTQLEISFAKHFHQIKIGGNVFYSFISDKIIGEVDPSTPKTGTSMMPFVKRFVNVDKANQVGTEVYLDYLATNELTFHADASFVQAENEDWDEPLAQIPPFRSHLSVKYNKTKFWTELEAKLTAGQDRIAPQSGESETSGYGLLNWRIGYKPLNNISIGASVINILDKDYYDHLNFSYKNSDQNQGRVYEMGRNITAYVKYQF